MEKNLKILIVEDQSDDRRLLRKILESMGYAVEEAVNGLEGLEIARLHKPCFIISDALMPEMDGFQFLRKIKKDEELKKIPFIFYSATYTSRMDKKLALSLGARAYIEKPLEPDMFIEKIESLIQECKIGKEQEPVELIEKEEEYLSKHSLVIAIKLEETVIELEKVNESLQQEITKRMQAEEKLQKINRSLKTISECNQALIHANDETDLLNDICGIIVKIGGYRFAWVGYAEKDKKKTIHPVAQGGYEEGYLDTLNLTWADTERGRGPTGTAIRTGKPSICRNILTDSKFAPWKAQAVKQGYESSVALPLISGDRKFGALNIYAAEPDVFDKEEIKLLTELAGDMAYGIAALRLRIEHKNAEEALQKSEKKFKKLIEYLPIAIAITDKNENIEYANRKYMEIIGYNFEDIKNIKEWYLLTYPDKEYRKHVIKKWNTDVEKAAKDSKEIKPSEYNITCKNGEIRTMEVSGTFVADKMLTIFNDITNRKQAEETLRESEERYRAVVENSHNGILIIGEDYQFGYVNDKLCEILGRSHKETIGHDFREFLDEDGKKFVEDMYVRRQRGEKVPSLYGFNIVRKDSEKRQVEISSTIVRDSKGRIRTIAQLLDITERKRMEATLRESEARFKLMFDNLGDAVYVTKIEGANTGQILEANTEATKQTGYTRDELLHMNIIRDIAIAKSAEINTDSWNKMIQEGKNVKVIEKKRKKDGTEFWTEVITTLIEFNEKKATLSINHDITERKKAEEELKDKMQKLEKWNKLTVGRELKMIELKKEINALLKKAGLSEKYKIIN